MALPRVDGLLERGDGSFRTPRVSPLWRLRHGQRFLMQRIINRFSTKRRNACPGRWIWRFDMLGVGVIPDLSRPAEAQLRESPVAAGDCPAPAGLSGLRPIFCSDAGAVTPIAVTRVGGVLRSDRWRLALARVGCVGASGEIFFRARRSLRDLWPIIVALAPMQAVLSRSGPFASRPAPNSLDISSAIGYTNPHGSPQGDSFRIGGCS